MTVLLTIIIAAYIDGGDEALRPIEQDIDVQLPYEPTPAAQRPVSRTGAR